MQFFPHIGNIFISLEDLKKEQNRLDDLRQQTNIKKKRKRPSRNNRAKVMGDWARMVKNVWSFNSLIFCDN